MNDFPSRSYLFSIVPVLSFLFYSFTIFRRQQLNVEKVLSLILSHWNVFHKSQTNRLVLSQPTRYVVFTSLIAGEADCQETSEPSYIKDTLAIGSTGSDNHSGYIGGGLPRYKDDVVLVCSFNSRHNQLTKRLAYCYFFTTTGYNNISRQKEDNTLFYLSLFNVTQL